MVLRPAQVAPFVSAKIMMTSRNVLNASAPVALNIDTLAAGPAVGLG